MQDQKTYKYWFNLFAMIAIVMSIVSCKDNSNTAPDPPELPPAATNIAADVISETEIMLRWQDNSDNENGFLIYQSIGDRANFQLIHSANPDAQMARLGNRTPATTYYYTVQAFSDVGSSPSPDTLRVSTLTAPPTAPTELSVSQPSRSSIRLQWEDNSANETRFEVYYGTDSTDLNLLIHIEPNSDFWVIDDLESLTNYFFKIRAVNNFGFSEFTNIVSLRTQFSGLLAIVADMAEGIRIIDVTDPSDLNIIGTYTPPGRAEDVVVRDSLLYIAYWDNGLRIVNIADPSAPKIISDYPLPNSYRICLWENTACITNWNALILLDIADPAHPAYLSAVQGGVSHVAVNRGFAYASTIQATFQIIDIADVHQPAVRSSFRNNAIDFLGVALNGHHAFIASDGGREFGGLQIFDVSNPDAVQFVSLFREPTAALDLTVHNNLIYLAAGEDGVYIINTRNPASPYLTSHFDTEGEARRVVVYGQTAYVSDGSGGLLLVDVSIPSQPEIIGGRETSGNTRSVFVLDYR